MKKIILSILVVVGVSLASLANSDERIKFLGVEMFMPFEDTVGQLTSIGLDCDQYIPTSRYKFVMCWGMVRSQETLKDERHPIALVTGYLGKTHGLSLNCVTFDFCNEAYGPWDLAMQLKTDGIIPSWTTILSRQRFTNQTTVNQEKKFAWEFDTKTIRSTNTVTYAYYCHHENDTDICIREHPNLYDYSLMTYLDLKPDVEFYGPVLTMTTYRLNKKDWNPTKWKQNGTSHFN